jgi:NTE family protein
MKERLTALIDFARLNSGELRVSVAATDLETGAPVIFDTAHTKLEMDHLLASCGFLPEFAPVEVNGRLLGDGGLSINTPFDPILEDIASGALLLYVVDLYARDGPRPTSFEAAAERKNDLLFGNQTFIRLGYLIRARALQMEMEGGLRGSRDRIFLLSYRPGIEEPGPEKSFDLSASAFAQRWNAGRLDMEHAQTLGPTGNLTIVRRQTDGPSEMGS